MKKSFVSLVIVFFFLSFPCCAFGELVMYNTQTGKYHALWCKWAKKCTVNCIKIEKKEAIKRGGIPCKVCGGN